MCVGLHVKYPLSLFRLMNLEFSLQILGESSDIKFHGNPSIGSRVVPCRRTDILTDMTKLIVAFCNSGNTPKNTGFFNFGF